MTTTRRSTLAAIGGLGTLATAGPALAVGEHEDDEREDESDADDTNGEKPAATAAVRVAHFSPDAPAVDVYVDDEQVLADVAYDTVSPYLEIAPGTYQVRITAAGDPDAVVFDDEVPVSRAFYTIAAIGELEAETFRPLILTDAGSALIRLAHVSPDAPAVDVVGSDGAPTLFENVSFGEATNYVALPAGTYSLDVRPAAGDGGDEAGGTSPDTDDADDETDEGAADAVATVEVTLETGTAYTAFATGYLEAEPAFAVRLDIDGPDAAEEPMDDEPVDDEPAEDEMDDDTDEYDDDEMDDEMDDDTDDYDDDDDHDDNGLDDDHDDTDDYGDNDTDDHDDIDDDYDDDSDDWSDDDC